MTIINILIITFCFASVLAFTHATLIIWTMSVGIGLALLSFSIALPTWIFILLCSAFTALVALNFKNIRLHTVTRLLLSVYRKLLPPISSTERIALEAGSVWWDGELFSGKPNWSCLLDLPQPGLTVEEQAYLDGPTNELCQLLDDWKITHELKELPQEVWDFIKKHNFFGMNIPKKYGGLGFSAQAHSAVVSKIYTRSGSAAISVMVPNSLGPGELLIRYGSESQKEHYLPRLAASQEIPCFALTSPQAGSDATSIIDRAVVCKGQYEGKEVLGFSISFEKRYITLAPVATLLGLALKTYDPDHLLGDEEKLGISLALVPAKHPGIHIGRRHYPARQAFPNGPLSAKDVFIPMNWIIGEQAGIGQGWRMLMNCLAVGRGISLPAITTGAVKFVARTTGAYARVRKQFNLPIGKFEGIEEPLARIAAEAYAMEAARKVTCVALDQGHEPAVISALMKYQMTERQRQCINDAMDIHGGRGICEGPGNYLFNLYQSIPINITVEGANILTRSLIVFGQGAIRCHPWLLKEMQAAKLDDQKTALNEFDHAVGGHVRFLLSNFARAFFHNITAGLLIRSPINTPVANWFKQVERSMLSFILLADVTLLLLGGKFKRREKLSGRFADVMSELYFMSCALKRFEDEGRPGVDRPLLDWVCANGLYNIQSSLAAILENYPNRLIGWFLKRLIFPWGQHFKPASDQLGQQLASMLLTPSEARDKLTDGIYLNEDPNDIIGRLEYAMRLSIDTESIEQRLVSAIKNGRIQTLEPLEQIEEALQKDILNENEADLLQKSRTAIRKAIDVDDFETQELTNSSSSVESLAN